MVDPISAKPVAGPSPLTATARVLAPATPTTADAAPAATPAPTALARSLAASAPVDTDRVAQIRSAIANGTYPILPETVADRLLALKLEWKPNDAA